MLRIEALFWISIVLCVLSFALLAYQVVVQVNRSKPTASSVGGLGDAKPHSLDMIDALKQMGELAGSFAKAGPIGTTAVLCVLFALIALLSSGVVKVG
jgi:hypothetical protein